MEVLLNATLAGGVVMGASCDLIVNPGFAMLTGAIAGGVSALGFLYLNAFFREKFNLHDTCGVHFLHGIPGLLGGFTSAVCCGASRYNFVHDPQLAQIFPHTWDTRTSRQQAGF